MPSAVLDSAVGLLLRMAWGTPGPNIFACGLRDNERVLVWVEIPSCFLHSVLHSTFFLPFLLLRLFWFDCFPAHFFFGFLQIDLLQNLFAVFLLVANLLHEQRRS